MVIREALDSDFDEVLRVERLAFGREDEAGGGGSACPGLTKLKGLQPKVSMRWDTQHFLSERG